MDHYHDRAAAGRVLAPLVRARVPTTGPPPVVLALPRGGVPVAAPVAAALGVPLDVLVARKLGAPGHEELGCGAIAEGLDHAVITAESGRLGLTGERLVAVERHERTELERRVQRYRAGRPGPGVEGRTVVVVDDGLATGVTAEAACRSVRLRHPARLLLAVPVAAPGTIARLEHLVDEVVCPLVPPWLGAVGAFYDDFEQTTDEQVLALLAAHRPEPQPHQPQPHQPQRHDPRHPAA